jgi:hypothetical protein
MIITQDTNQAQSAQERIFNDLLQQNRELQAENCQWREHYSILAEFIIEQGFDPDDIIAQATEDAPDQKTDKKQDAFTSPTPTARIAELEERNRRQDQQISELQDELRHVQADNLRRRESEERYMALFDWTRKLFANKSIPAAVKFVLWHCYMCIIFMRPSPVGEELRIGMESAGAALGCDTGTVRKAIDKAEAWELMQRRYETVKDANGDTKKFVYITLNEALTAPESIQMEKRHGGARERRCPHCGSTDVDRYTVQHCRHCHTNAWYGQPGLRADANVLDAQKAQNHMIHSAIAPADETDKKQDAFGPSASFAPDEPDPIAVSNRLEVMIDQTEERINSQGQKQDAFGGQDDEFADRCDCGAEVWRYSATGMPYCEPCWHTTHLSAGGAAPLPTTEREVFTPLDDQGEAPITAGNVASAQLAAEHSPSHSHGKLPEMELHRPVCRHCGPIPQWIWSPVDQARICPKCYSPQP